MCGCIYRGTSTACPNDASGNQTGRGPGLPTIRPHLVFYASSPNGKAAPHKLLLRRRSLTLSASGFCPKILSRKPQLFLFLFFFFPDVDTTPVKDSFFFLFFFSGRPMLESGGWL